MTICWQYDNSPGGDFDVEPEDFCGMTHEQVVEAIHRMAKERARNEVWVYVPDLYDYAGEIVEANEGV